MPKRIQIFSCLTGCFHDCHNSTIMQKRPGFTTTINSQKVMLYSKRSFMRTMQMKSRTARRQVSRKKSVKITPYSQSYNFLSCLKTVCYGLLLSWPKTMLLIDLIPLSSGWSLLINMFVGHKVLAVLAGQVAYLVTSTIKEVTIIGF